MNISTMLGQEGIGTAQAQVIGLPDWETQVFDVSSKPAAAWAKDMAAKRNQPSGRLQK